MKQQKKSICLGAHMSIAGGVSRAMIEGHQIGCQTVQIFTKNSNQWKAAPLDAAEIVLFKEKKKEFCIDPVVAHNSYLINLASPDPVLKDRSRAAMRIELERAEALGLRDLIMHPGAHMGSGDEKAIAQVGAILSQLLQETASYQVGILLENTAGQGSCIGHRFEHLKKIIEVVKGAKAKRLGVCLDTCHLFAAGYDIATRKGYEATMQQLEETLGLERVRAFHINDSKKGLFSHVDRHEHIGKGTMGLEAFQFLLNDERLSGIPMILETPKEEGLLSDKKNLEVLRSLLK